ncbi:hypothetical protein DICSQDRAFT_169927 [Dichomitus squalens LYAD-421 SS1]|uniref:Uncharacterized protein n=1 Tax=Dichomitus squalens (strain LYAD-421) TaxID=732165 RepID=R7SZW3_DICSQ|nr:uncharacterized protein DICSQDRAFT_169927 [Dichomitus squalens LYAD-421 SS1]EJF61508.1 hypothetical protein DICSQDRAFT_169927 [Dichomitus squalens LYAD-421 SS1]
MAPLTSLLHLASVFCHLQSDLHLRFGLRGHRRLVILLQSTLPTSIRSLPTSVRSLSDLRPTSNSEIEDTVGILRVLPIASPKSSPRVRPAPTPNPGIPELRQHSPNNHLDYDSPEDEHNWDDDGGSRDKLYVMCAEFVFMTPNEEKETVPSSIQYDAKRILQSFQLEATTAPTKSLKNVWLYNSHIYRLKDPKNQPVCDPEAQQPICIEMMINSVPAYTLIDMGCTMVAMSPGQAFISKADGIDL